MCNSAERKFVLRFPLGSIPYENKIFPTFRIFADDSSFPTDCTSASAMVIFPSIVDTREQRTFVTGALNIAQPSHSSFLSTECTPINREGRFFKTQHSANYISVFFVPLFVADPPPGIVVINLYNTLFY